MRDVMTEEVRTSSAARGASSPTAVDVALPFFQVRKVKEIEDEQWEGMGGPGVGG